MNILCEISEKPFEFIMAMTALVSAIIAFTSYFYSRVRLKNEKACELAKYYADHIIWKMSAVETILNDFVKYPSLDVSQTTDKLYFTYDEARGKLKKQGIKTEDFDKDISGLNNKYLQYLLKYHFKTQEYFNFSKLVQDIDNVSIDNAANDLIYDLLNEMEWFSMNFTYGVAAEDLVYQSLHKTFLSNVAVLYYKISSMNKTPDAMLFTNIIKLFNDWRQREIKTQRKLNRDAVRRKKNEQKLYMYNGKVQK